MRSRHDAVHAESTMSRPPSPSEPASRCDASPGPTDREADLLGLLARSHAGDTGAFARLYDITSPRLLGIIGRIQRERDEAEEVLQEVYLKVWNARTQFDNARGGVEQWLAGIARHGAIDSIRKRERRPAQSHAFDDEDVYEHIASHDADPLEAAVRADLAQAIRACVRSLGAEQRQCLFHAFWQELSHDEIARATGHPLGTVKSWMRRSLQTMRIHLAPLQA